MKKERIFFSIALLVILVAEAYRKKVEGWNNKMFIENRTLHKNSHPLWFKDGKP